MILTFAILIVLPAHTNTHAQASIIIILIHPQTHTAIFSCPILQCVCVRVCLCVIMQNHLSVFGDVNIKCKYTVNFSLNLELYKPAIRAAYLTQINVTNVPARRCFPHFKLLVSGNIL